MNEKINEKKILVRCWWRRRSKKFLSRQNKMFVCFSFHPLWKNVKNKSFRYVRVNNKCRQIQNNLESAEMRSWGQKWTFQKQTRKKNWKISEKFQASGDAQKISWKTSRSWNEKKNHNNKWIYLQNSSFLFKFPRMMPWSNSSVTSWVVSKSKVKLTLRENSLLNVLRDFLEKFCFTLAFTLTPHEGNENRKYFFFILFFSLLYYKRSMLFKFIKKIFPFMWKKFFILLSFIRFLSYDEYLKDL